jgi:hypothetical protein
MLQKETAFARSITRTFGILLAGILLTGIAQAGEPKWFKVAYRTSAQPSLHQLARKHHDLFQFFLDNSLEGEGKKTFLKVAKQVRNRIAWSEGKSNAYNEAFRNSWSFVKSVDLQGMPDTIMLIPYLESQWHGKRGRKSGDYGYWQLIPEVIREIQTLDYVPAGIRKSSVNTVREDALMSTQAAQVHLHRYHFYFANVAGFSESDAWLLTFTAFNWGAGNVKRMIADMEAEGVKANYSNFYQRLYAAHKKNPGDLSLTAGVEYVPKLWNIAQLINASN